MARRPRVAKFDFVAMGRSLNERIDAKVGSPGNLLGFDPGLAAPQAPKFNLKGMLRHPIKQRWHIWDTLWKKRAFKRAKKRGDALRTNLTVTLPGQPAQTKSLQQWILDARAQLRTDAQAALNRLQTAARTPGTMTPENRPRFVAEYEKAVAEAEQEFMNTRRAVLQAADKVMKGK